MGTRNSHRRKAVSKSSHCSYRTSPCYAKGPQYEFSKELCNWSNEPATDEGKELLALWEQICPNFDPNYIPPEPEDPYAPICVQCLPANPALEVIFGEIADILEL